MATESRAQSLVRMAGVLSVALFLALVARFWHPVYGLTAFFQLDATNDDVKLAAFRELPVYVFRDNGPYDGLYYAQLALDPSLRDPELPRAMDSFPYRARRILPAALAWLLGAGRPAWITLAYSLLNVGAWLGLAALLWRLLEVRDARGWLAWAGVMFSAGALGSVRLALTDLVAATILAAAIFAAERWRGRAAVALLAAADLARETSLLGVVGLCEPPWFSTKNFLRVALAAAPLGGWLLYVRWRAGPADPGWGNFTWPVIGFVEKARASVAAAFTHGDPMLAWTTLLAVIALAVQAAFFFTRVRLAERWWRIGAAYAGLMLFLGPAVWEGFPGAVTRVLLPLTLAFNILAHRTRAPIAWLVAGNLTIFSGLLVLRDVPHDPREIAAVRRGGTACIARIGEGWFGREEHGRHAWNWASRHGTLALEAWPRGAAAKFELQFSLRGITPCTVRVRQADRELARFEVGAKTAPFRLPVAVTNGRAEIEFATDAPPRIEPGGTRALAFALYDPRLVVAEPE